jgi:hypothetical protein
VNRSEAAQLLAHCAAFDNRTVGRVDADGWAAALHDVPFDDDTRAAVARYYGTPPDRPGDRLWIQPHHVRSGRLAIRRERYGDTLPAYLPPAELETGAQYVVRRRAQIDAVASGRAPSRPIPLNGPPARSVLEGLAERGFDGLDGRRGLAPAGRPVPDGSEQAAVAEVRRPGPLGVECPACQAAIGRPCRNEFHGRRRVLGKPHAARARVAAGGPAVVESAEDIERRREEYLARLARMAGAAS